MKRSLSTFVLVALLPLGTLVTGCSNDAGDSTDTGGAAGTTGGAAGTTGGSAGTTGGAAGAGNGGKSGTAGSSGGTAGTGGKSGAAGTTGGAAGTTGGAAGTTGGAAGTTAGAAGTTGGAAGTTGGAAGTTGGTAGTSDGGTAGTSDGGTAGTSDGGTAGTTGGAAGTTGGAAGTTGGTTGTTGGAAGTAGTTGGAAGTTGTTGGAAGATAGNAGTAGTAGTTGGSAGTGGTGTAPTTCDASHGAIGCCSEDGKTTYYFEGAEVASQACKGDTVCTWNADGYYECGTGPAAADPSGEAPLACGGAPLPTDLTGCPVPCTKDADCASSQDGSLFCDTKSGVCVGCLVDTDCSDPAAPFCDTGTCVECKNNADCSGSANGPVCVVNFGLCGCSTDQDCKGNPSGTICDPNLAACVGCSDDFGCTDPKAPSCVQGACAANSQCTGDDLFEDADDGPLGATDITPTLGNASSTTGHSICGQSSYEADYFKFTASDGDIVALSLSWADSDQDLDLTVTDAKGGALALNLFDASPANIILSYLPKGTYYVSVKRFDGDDNTDTTPYSLDLKRTTGNKCASISDCAKDGGNTATFRGSCNEKTGACEAIDGKGAVAKGGACDSSDDCSSSHCAETSFNESAAKYAVCTVACAKDADCGSGQVCTTFYQTNICIPKCTKDTECPVNFQLPVADGEHWPYMTCDTKSGSCSLN